MFTPDQYSQIAKSYDSAASDPLVPDDKRQEFAKRAKWFHYLAAREKGTVAGADCGQGSSRPPANAFAPYLTTLWVMGAALYLIGTLLFTNAIGLFGDDSSSQVSELAPPVERGPQITGFEGKAKASVPAVERPHAISPDQPPYEAPELMLPKSAEHELSALPLTTEQPSAPTPTADPETLKVTEAATIRNGPSITAKAIGTATPGAELEVRGRENGWIQFIDPSSGNSGWIQSTLVSGPNEPTQESATQAATVEEVQTPQQKKPAKKARMAQPRPKLGQRLADLPEDEDFLVDRGPRRKGLFGKRRMLREGLMSPGFRPPQ